MNYAGIALKRGLSWYDSTNVPPESSFVLSLFHHLALPLQPKYNLMYLELDKS